MPTAIAAALEASGPIDVLVNNAGIGMFGAFEATSMSIVRSLFETNTFGVMAMTQAVLPQMRARQTGVVVNVTSSATLVPMPLVAASKAAIEGFTGSLTHELKGFGIRLKLVEPGHGPTTRFTQNVTSPIQDTIPEAYAAYAQSVLVAFGQPAAVTREADVAEAVWRAANDALERLRYRAGADAVTLAQAS